MPDALGTRLQYISNNTKLKFRAPFRKITTISLRRLAWLKIWKTAFRTKRWGQENRSCSCSVLEFLASCQLARSPKTLSSSDGSGSARTLDIIGRSWKTKTLNISQFFFVFFPPQVVGFSVSETVPSSTCTTCLVVRGRVLLSPRRPKKSQRMPKGKDFPWTFYFALHVLFLVYRPRLIGKSLKFISQSSYSRRSTVSRATNVAELE